MAFALNGMEIVKLRLSKRVRHKDKLGTGVIFFAGNTGEARGGGGCNKAGQERRKPHLMSVIGRKKLQHGGGVADEKRT